MAWILDAMMAERRLKLRASWQEDALLGLEDVYERIQKEKR